MAMAMCLGNGALDLDEMGNMWVHLSLLGP